MKKFMLTVAVVFLSLGVACADADRPITVDQLPQKAQQFLKSYFPQMKVSFAKEDSEFFTKEYEVLLSEGVKIEFDGDGAWKSVDYRTGGVPVAIVPKAIAEYVTAHYPDAKITKIEIDRREYEVSLSNRLELTFDRNFNVIDIDD